MVSRTQLSPPPAPRWMVTVLRLAAVYNVMWGTLAVLMPVQIFRWMGMAEPNYPSLFQCIGMIVGVYGIGYWIAATNPYRHWPIVLVGLLGKVLGPIGLPWAVWKGELPWTFGIHNITNDLIWWVPFTLILYRAWQANRPGTAADRRP